MPAPRLAPLDPPYDPAVAEQLERWMPPGADAPPLALFRTLARHDALMARMRPLGAAILGPKATVPLRLRELMIDRTCALTGAEYEWGVHVAAFGAAAELDPARLAATATGTPPQGGWEPAEEAVVRLAEELHATNGVSDELWASLTALLDERQIIELIVTAGWYHAIAYVCNGLRVPLEPWAARFAS